MKYIESPNTYKGDEPSIFLAGGITGCSNWQAWAVAYLSGNNIAIFNPRRENFPIHDPNAAEAQIRWEAEHLDKSDAVLFWFPHETLCPIVLYELGAWSMTKKPIFVGCHPEYQRRQDVIIQTAIKRPEVAVVDTVYELCAQVIRSIDSFSMRDYSERDE